MCRVLSFFVTVMLSRSSTDTAFLPDSDVGAPEPPRLQRPLGLTVMLFLGAFALLQWGWNEARGTWIEQLVIDQMTVKTAVALINAVDPAIEVQAVGSRLKATGGGINILNGCEGIEVVFLLASAMLVAPIAWRARLLGLGVGSIVVFLLNQGRVIALFYAFRGNRALFDTLHGVIAPLLLILAAGAFFIAWLSWHGSRRRVNPEQ